MFYGTSVLERDFVEMAEKGTREHAFRRAIYEAAWLFVWVAFIIPAILVISAVVFFTVYFAYCGSTWAIMLVVSAIAGIIHGHVDARRNRQKRQAVAL